MMAGLAVLMGPEGGWKTLPRPPGRPPGPPVTPRPSRDPPAPSRGRREGFSQSRVARDRRPEGGDRPGIHAVYSHVLRHPVRPISNRPKYSLNIPGLTPQTLPQPPGRPPNPLKGEWPGEAGGIHEHIGMYGILDLKGVTGRFPPALPQPPGPLKGEAGGVLRMKSSTGSKT
jgi:hypothetical protein